MLELHGHPGLGLGLLEAELVPGAGHDRFGRAGRCRGRDDRCGAGGLEVDQDEPAVDQGGDDAAEGGFVDRGGELGVLVQLPAAPDEPDELVVELLVAEAAHQCGRGSRRGCRCARRCGCGRGRLGGRRFGGCGSGRRHRCVGRRCGSGCGSGRRRRRGGRLDLVEGHPTGSAVPPHLGARRDLGVGDPGLHRLPRLGSLLGPGRVQPVHRGLWFGHVSLLLEFVPGDVLVVGRRGRAYRRVRPCRWLRGGG
ncbi:MAG: hypothetical protein EKK62_04900 [Acidimicrobiia bacterium]|nr:MAG: hypothetical protein EKK62_04900 [Acidimicrobiia bacterium]